MWSSEAWAVAKRITCALLGALQGASSQKSSDTTAVEVHLEADIAGALMAAAGNMAVAITDWLKQHSRSEGRSSAEAYRLCQQEEMPLGKTAGEVMRLGFSKAQQLLMLWASWASPA
jgi:hypothetical protein